MSRVGKAPVTIPQGVDVKIDNGEVKVKGPKGELSANMVKGIEVKVAEKEVQVTRQSDSKDARAYHGLVRSLINNMVTGVSTGFSRQLLIHGVGYRANVKGSTVELFLGYSHPIEYPLPKGVSAQYDKAQNSLTLNSHDKELLGLVAAKIRGFRGPEPYKGKGIRYSDENIRRKAGKAGAAS